MNLLVGGKKGLTNSHKRSTTAVSDSKSFSFAYDIIRAEILICVGGVKPPISSRDTKQSIRLPRLQECIDMPFSSRFEKLQNSPHFVIYLFVKVLALVHSLPGSDWSH